MLHIENQRKGSHILNFSRIIFKCGKDIYCPKILNEFDYGGSALVDVCIIDNLMRNQFHHFWCHFFLLTRWGRVMHICVDKLTIIGSDNGLSPDRRQAIIWTHDGISLIWNLWNKLQWNLNRNANIFIQENAFESVVCETAVILSRPQCVKAI